MNNLEELKNNIEDDGISDNEDIDISNTEDDEISDNNIDNITQNIENINIQEEKENQFTGNEWRILVNQNNAYAISNIGYIRKEDTQELIISNYNDVILDGVTYTITNLLDEYFTKEEMEGTWINIIRGYKRYMASYFGVIKNKLSGRILKPSGISYVFVGIYSDKTNKSGDHLLHQLITLAFLPNRRPDQKGVNHINTIKTDNRLINLEWASPQEQSDHAVKLGLYKKKTNPVTRFDLKGIIMETFIGITEAGKKYDEKSIRKACLYGNIYKESKWKFEITDLSLNPKDLEGEIWKEYENINYHVSNLGRAKNINKNRLLTIYDANGTRKYGEVCIARKVKTIHTVVCTVFHGPRPSSLHEAHHKDSNTKNNRADNLEWILGDENNKIAHAKAVNQYDKNNIFIASYPSIVDANIALGRKRNSFKISNCCNGKQKTAFGFIWKHAATDLINNNIDSKEEIKENLIEEVKENLIEEVVNNIKPKKINNHGAKEIIQYDKEWNYIAEFKSMTEAANAIGRKLSTLSEAYKKGTLCNECKWKLKKDDPRINSPDLDGEIWKQFRDTNYNVSNLERMKNTKTNMLLSIQNLEERIYNRITLYINKEATNFDFHIVVCEVFHGPRPSLLHEAHHKDSNIKNNKADNVEWIHNN